MYVTTSIKYIHRWYGCASQLNKPLDSALRSKCNEVIQRKMEANEYWMSQAPASIAEQTKRSSLDAMYRCTLFNIQIKSLGLAHATVYTHELNSTIKNEVVERTNEKPTLRSFAIECVGSQSQLLRNICSFDSIVKIAKFINKSARK